MVYNPSTNTLTATNFSGALSSTSSLNMNNNPITNCSLISPGTNNKFSVITLAADQTTRNADIPSPYNGQFCFLLDTKSLQYYNSTTSSWVTYV
jgi:hypothetical protein